MCKTGLKNLIMVCKITAIYLYLSTWANYLGFVTTFNHKLWRGFSLKFPHPTIIKTLLLSYYFYHFYPNPTITTTFNKY